MILGNHPRRIEVLHSKDMGDIIWEKFKVAFFTK